MSETDKDQKLDVDQAATYLRISRSSIYRLIRAGELQAEPTGPKHGLMVRESSLEEFVQRREAQSCI